MFVKGVFMDRVLLKQKAKESLNGKYADAIIVTLLTGLLQQYAKRL